MLIYFENLLTLELKMILLLKSTSVSKRAVSCVHTENISVYLTGVKLFYSVDLLFLSYNYVLCPRMDKGKNYLNYMTD